jgi:23S rRNA pseudouridine1911/1915/1917 synthase
MSSIGHPVYNDTLYGFGKIKIKTEEQVLQSYKLEFTRPFTEERISLEIPPDSKIKKVIQALKQSN